MEREREREMEMEREIDREQGMSVFYDVKMSRCRKISSSYRGG